MDLSNWQERLALHFAEIRKGRPSAKPLFALEHGLAPDDLASLELAVRGAIFNYDARRHWLPLVIYASEIGYRYTGDEYWQTFADETPRWNVFGRRDWIRSSFRKFSKQFGGIKPSGIWAEHFSIIAWPIAHALLPKDLQRELARLLFESRFTFSPELFRSSETFGQHLERRSSSCSSRFRIFAQEHLLLGEISNSLLFHGHRDDEPPILATTLQRIVGDLEEEQRSRAWLEDAQRRARDVKLRGLTRRSFGPSRGGTHDPIDDIGAFSVEPKILLRPGNDAWHVLLEFPNLSRLVDFEPALSTARPTVIGSVNRLARSWHLYEPCRTQLAVWPCAEVPVLKFDVTASEIEALLKAQCFIRPAPNWLFKIGADGLGHQIHAGVIRSGQKYILLTDGDQQSESSTFPRIHLSCVGIVGTKLEIPDVVSEEMVEGLRKLNLTVGTTVDVWPVGSPAVVWDGEGYGEWAGSQPILLGIRTGTSESVEIAVELDGKEETLITILVRDGSEPVFVDLTPLPSGDHRIKVSVTSVSTPGDDAYGYLTLRVKEPESWDVLRYTQIPFFVSMNPPNPTLEEFWENRATVELLGPGALQINIDIHLESKDRKALWHHRLPPLRLPVEVETWHHQFRTHVLGQSDAIANYDRAYSCRLEFTVPEFGTAKLHFEREFIETRWSVTRIGRKASTVQLVDEGDDESGGQVLVREYSFLTPDRRQTIPYEQAIGGITIGTEGGLFVATRRDRSYSVILPLLLEITSFHDLRLSPSLQSRVKDEPAVTELIELSELWTGARIVGGLESTLRQRDVLIAIQRELLRLCGGKRWTEAEERFEGQPSDMTLRDLAEEISKNPIEGRIGSELLKRSSEFAHMELDERIIAFATLLKKYLVAGAKRRDLAEAELWFAEFALRFCSSPESLRRWAQKRFAETLTYQVQAPAITRAARFFVLSSEFLNPQKPLQAVPLHRTWHWS